MDRRISRSFPLSRVLDFFRREPQCRDRRVALAVEALEDRLCPATDIWSGAGGNANWSNGKNWQGGVAPTVGQSLVFEKNPVSTVSYNDYKAGTTFGNITIAGNGYDITGNRVLLKGGLTATNKNVTPESAINTVGIDITLATSETIQSAYGGTVLVLTGAIDNGGNLLTVHTGGSEIWFDGGTLKGAGGLTVDVMGKCLLEDTDTYTGTTTVNSTNVYLDALNPNAMTGPLVIGLAQGTTGLNEEDVVRLCTDNQIASTCAVTIYPSGLLDLDGYSDTIGSLTMIGGNLTTGSPNPMTGAGATLTVKGGITVQASPNTALISTGPGDNGNTPDEPPAGNLVLGSSGIKVASNTSSTAPSIDLEITLNVGGSAGLNLSGGGVLQFSGDNTYTAGTTVSAGTLRAASSAALGDGNVTVASGATLQYENSSAAGPLNFGPLYVNGNLSNSGTVNFNDDGSPCTMMVAGNYTQSTGATLNLKLDGATAFDQMQVSGLATLAGTLNFLAPDGYAPMSGNAFSILTYGSYSGKFGTVHLAKPVTGAALSTSYGPKSIVVTATGPATGTTGGSTSSVPVFTWTGAGGNDDWSNGLNWAGGFAPSKGDALVFPSAPVSLLSCNDYAAGTAFYSITIAGSGYQISGDMVTLADGLTATNGTGTSTVSLPIALSAAQTIGDSAGGSLVLAGLIANGGNLLTVNAGGNITFDGTAISGSGGLTVEGSGTFTLSDSAADSYTGATLVESGTLAVTNAGALSSAITVDAGATLALEGGASGLTFASSLALTLNGSNIGDPGTVLNVSGNNTWNGTITLDGTSDLNAAPGTVLTVNGIISGASESSNLYTEGTGTVVLTGADTYWGHTVVAAGTLVAANPTALGAWQVGTSIYSGATLALAGGSSGADFGEEGISLEGGTLENLSGNNRVEFPISLSNSSTITCAQGTALADNVQLTIRSYTLTVSGAGNFDVHSDILGSGGIVKDGTGTLSFSGLDTNLYTGNTVINAGTLLLEKPAPLVAIGNAALPRSEWPTVTIAAGATLAGTGIIDANIINYGVIDLISPALQGIESQAQYELMLAALASSGA